MVLKIKKLLSFIVNLINDKREPLAKLPTYLPNQILGWSTNQKPITCYQFGNGLTSLLFIAGIHGNEVGTVKLAYQLILWLGKNQLLFPRLSFYIIPCLNPDGFSLAQKHHDYFNNGLVGRVNGCQVDLNRNFPTANFQSIAAWNYGVRYANQRPVFAGSYGGSEPETNLLIQLIKKIQPKITISFHNAGRDILSSQDVLAQQLACLYQKISNYQLLTQSIWKSLDQTGTLKEWCEDNSFPFLEIETDSRYNSNWLINQPAIEKIANQLSLPES